MLTSQNPVAELSDGNIGVFHALIDNLYHVLVKEPNVFQLNDIGLINMMAGILTCNKARRDHYVA